MRTFMLVGMGISVLLLAVAGNTTIRSNAQSNDSTIRAKNIWELAVQAQGGRERLHKIRSIATMSSEVTASTQPKSAIKSSSLYVLPDKWWSMVDERPTIFGLNMQMKNWATGKAYFTNFEEKKEVVLKSIRKEDKSNNLAGLIGDLLETNWNKPVVESWTSGEIGNVKVDIIRTNLLENRIDFAFDQVTHLPLQVSAFSKNGSSSRVSMSEFKDFNGVLLPTIVVIHSNDGDIKYRRTYEIDAAYDESIFQRPPSFEKGLSAWKKE